MSDAPHGPGWWLASDGNWYPPESHANYQPVPVYQPVSAPVPVGRRDRISGREVLQWAVMVGVGGLVGFFWLGVVGFLFGAMFVAAARTLAWVVTR